MSSTNTQTNCWMSFKFVVLWIFIFCLCALLFIDPAGFHVIWVAYISTDSIVCRQENLDKTTGVLSDLSHTIRDKNIHIKRKGKVKPWRNIENDMNISLFLCTPLYSAIAKEPIVFMEQIFSCAWPRAWMAAFSALLHIPALYYSNCCCLTQSMSRPKNSNGLKAAWWKIICLLSSKKNTTRLKLDRLLSSEARLNKCFFS